MPSILPPNQRHALRKISDLPLDKWHHRDDLTIKLSTLKCLTKKGYLKTLDNHYFKVAIPIWEI